MLDSTSNIFFDIPKNKSASIKVIGVGGGGSNAVNYMYEEGITGVDFVICNTDAQALLNSSVPNKIQLGLSTTEGLGAGSNPEIGEQAAIESIDEIKSLLNENTKMLFITAGMGGGTGTGAAPIIASVAKDMGILVVGIVTIPFQFEGKRRTEQAEEGIEKLRKQVDSLIVINNNKLRELYGNLGYKSGFAKADEVLTTASKGIAEVITHHYRQNIDLKDAKTVLSNSGTAIMGSAKASGENRAHEAISQALDSPLLNDNKIIGAKNVLLLIVSGSHEVTLDEIGVISDYIQSEAGHNANIIMGIGEENNLDDAISVTIVATGFPIDDQRYTGKEEEKVFHTLVEDQAISKKLPIGKTQFFSHENESVNSNYKQSIALDTMDPFLALDKTEQHLGSPNLFNLEEVKIISKEVENSNESFLDESTIAKEEIQIFTLEEDELEGQDSIEINEPESEIKFSFVSPTAETTPEINPIETEDSPFDEPLNKALKNSIEERRNRLKKFNYQFSNNLNQFNENLTTPAYARQGVLLNEKTEQSLSQFVVGEGKNNEIKLKPNGFLHNNAD